jgi:hypothetical protein
MDNRDGPALNMWGEYKVSDRSWGLISRPGYHQILADYLAREIVTTLKDLYRVSTGEYFGRRHVRQTDTITEFVNPTERVANP